LAEISGKQGRKKMNFRGGSVPTRGIPKRPGLIYLCFLVCLNLMVGGYGSISAAPVQTGMSERSFQDFIVVVPGEGDTFSSLSARYLKDPSWDWFIAEFNGIDVLKIGRPLVVPLKPEKRGGITLHGYQTVPILAYHNFSPAEAGKLTVTQPMFERQMRFLREAGYRVISMDRLFDFLEFKGSIPPQSVVLTIDDGWLSAYEIAMPILKKHGYPATLFVYTDIIGKSAKTLSWDLLGKMANEGLDVQCHTKSHRNLTVPGEKESFREYFQNLEGELWSCRDTIKKRLNREVKYLAYPYGLTNSLVVETAKKLGYRGALTINRGGNPFFTHNFRVNRSEIHGDFTMSQFEKNLAVFQEQNLK
jgi:peptidoglycan/xylan/chitin deacetylase (PgdA/CDA1 family)